MPNFPEKAGILKAEENSDGGKAEDIKQTNSDDDFVESCVVAAACLGLGLPFLILLELYWSFCMWPLRIPTIGGLLLGVYFAHSALILKYRQRSIDSITRSKKKLVIYESIFWTGVLVFSLLVGLFLYSGSRNG